MVGDILHTAIFHEPHHHLVDHGPGSPPIGIDRVNREGQGAIPVIPICRYLRIDRIGNPHLIKSPGMINIISISTPVCFLPYRCAVHLQKSLNHMFKLFRRNFIHCAHTQIVIGHIGRRLSHGTLVKDIKYVTKIQFAEIFFTPVCIEQVVLFVPDGKDVLTVQFATGFLQGLHAEGLALLRLTQCQQIQFLRVHDPGKYQIPILRIVPVVSDIGALRRLLHSAAAVSVIASIHAYHAIRRFQRIHCKRPLAGNLHNGYFPGLLLRHLFTERFHLFSADHIHLIFTVHRRMAAGAESLHQAAHRLRIRKTVFLCCLSEDVQTDLFPVRLLRCRALPIRRLALRPERRIPQKYRQKQNANCLQTRLPVPVYPFPPHIRFLLCLLHPPPC